MSARNLSSGMLSAIAAQTVRPALFFEGVFYSGGADQYLRLWTGTGQITWNGYTWTGGGQLLGISPLEETGDLKAAGFTVQLSGMPSALIATALGSVRQGKSGKLWLALFDAAGALIADPYPLRRGRCDVAVIEDNGETCTIAVQYEDRLVDMERPRERRYTAEDQKIDYPSDLGFDYVPSLQDAVFTWG